MIVAAVGGTASVVSGGKFANGAVTAAFAYLYNQAAHNGDPNTRHEMGRREAMVDAAKNGYEIFRRTETKVSLPGLPSRIYDFVVLDPVTDQQIGVEVKTSWLETIFLNVLQVSFDVTVANGKLGPARGSGGVAITACSTTHIVSSA